MQKVVKRQGVSHYDLMRVGRYSDLSSDWTSEVKSLALNVSLSLTGLSLLLLGTFISILRAKKSTSQSNFTASL